MYTGHYNILSMYVIHTYLKCFSAIYIHTYYVCMYMAPSGLYARLCHAFSIFIFFYEQNYLSVYWTDFNNFFTKWKVFA